MRNISEAALLVKMEISVWGATKTDRHLSGQVTNSVNGEAGAYRVVKNIIPKQFLDPIQANANALRRTFRKYTAPWLFDGTGILPITLHDKFMQEFLDRKGKMEQSVEDLVRDMPTVRHRAQVYSGDGYNPDDIPSDDALREMFRVRIKFMPIATENDFRINMNEEVIEAIKNDYAQEVQEQTDQVTVHAFMRVVEVLDNMIEGLERHGDVKPGGKRASYFKDSTINHVHELSEILGDLNVTNNPDLAKVSDELKDKMASVGAAQLRDDEELRRIVTDEAKAIRQQAKDSVSSFFGR